MVIETAQAGKTARPKLEMRLSVADEVVLVKIACESRKKRRTSHNSLSFILQLKKKMSKDDF